MPDLDEHQAIGLRYDMAEAYREIAPGATYDPSAYVDGMTYLACLVNWIQTGCPVLDGTEVAMESVAAEKVLERPKKGPIWGMGKVH